MLNDGRHLYCIIERLNECRIFSLNTGLLWTRKTLESFLGWRYREKLFSKGPLLGPESTLDLMSAFDSFHPFIKSWVGPLIFVTRETPLAGYSGLSFPRATYITVPIKD